MKKHYFTINETAGDHIGTITATDQNELTLGIEQALTDHFDENCTVTSMPAFIKLLDPSGKKIHEITFYNEDSQEESFLDIQLTWLYFTQI